MERTQDAGVLGAVRRVGAILCVLMMFGSAPLAQEMLPAGEQFAMALQAHVVRITANWRDGSTQHGFGFVVGERNNELYIVTADHVVRGTLPDELAETIGLTFFSHQGQEFQAKLLGTHDADRDVAVLLAERPGGFRLQPEIMRRSRDALPARGTQVWYVGRSGRWYVPSTPGTVNSVDLDERILIDGLNVQVGTSGAPLVAADGIAGMIVADDAGGVSRASGVGFIERAFEHWAHPWQLRAADVLAPPPEEAVAAPAPEVSAPWQRAPGISPPPATTPAPTREPIQEGAGEPATTPAPRREPAEEGAGEPATVVDLDQIRRALEADLAHYDPTASAAQASAYQPGMLAPALWLLGPAIRVAGADRLEIDSNVTLEDLDLGRVTAVVTPAAEDLLAVAVTFERTNWRTAECAVDFQPRAFDLTWDSRIGAFTGLRAAFAPIQVICPDLSVRAASLQVDSAMSEENGARWGGHLQAALEGLQVTESTGDNLLRTDAAEFRIAFEGVDLNERARMVAALPGNYWPRRAALLGIPFDFRAADLGVLPNDLAQRYAREISRVDFVANVRGLKAVVEDGSQAIDVVVADGAIEARSSAPAGLSYRHDGLSVKGAEIGLPRKFAADLRLERGGSGAVLGGFAEVESEQGFVSFLQEVGPVTWQMASAGGQSSIEGGGQIWAASGAAAPSATATLLTEDPTGFLLETILSAAAEQADPKALRRAIDETIGQIAQVEEGPAGPRYRFEIALDFETETMAINGVDLDELNLFLNDACTRYGC
jgi:Trypsin-like peptidase domain